MATDNQLTPAELEQLGRAFVNELNYESDDPLTPIDPLTYRNPDGDTCLHIAARRGDIRSIELLLKAGLNINDRGDMGTTPLHCAKTQEVIEFLVANGASVDIRDEFGRLPLEATGSRSV